MPKSKRAPIPAAVYTHEEVASLFAVERSRIYEMPHVMACRLPGKPVRYSMRRIDAILNLEDAA